MLRVGALAAATGVSIRTLHHYEDIGLLAPERHASSGYRLYGRADIERLYRIRALRQLGLPLAEIQRSIDAPTSDLAATAERQLAAVDRQLGDFHRQRRALRAVRASTSAPDLIKLLETMTVPRGTVERHISILVYADLRAAHAYLVEVFGLGPGELSLGPDGEARSTASSRRATGSCAAPRVPRVRPGLAPQHGTGHGDDGRDLR